MVQVKKNEIDQQILISAAKLFSLAGYSKTTIQDISKDADVSVGNIYRYYKNKKMIFEAIISEYFVDEFKIVLEKKILGTLDGKDFVAFLIENKERFLLLFTDAKGTKYENLAQDLIEFMTQKVIDQYLEQSNDNLKLMIANIYESYINIMKWIIQNYEAESDIIIQLDRLNKYHQSGIVALIKGRN